MYYIFWDLREQSNRAFLDSVEKVVVSLKNRFIYLADRELFSLILTLVEREICNLNHNTLILLLT